jgi:hypothetical protein
MSHIVAKGFHNLDQLIDRFQEVNGDEVDARVLPIGLANAASGRDDNLGPVA